MQKKKKYQHNETMLLKFLSKLDIKKEILRLKRFESDSGSNDDTDTD